MSVTPTDPPLEHESPPDAEPELVESLIAHALELRDQGHADWLQRATVDAPQLAEAIAAAVADTDRMAELFGESLAAPVSGTTFDGRFRIGRRLGAGAMGVVHLAEDLKLIRPVAVKILHAAVVDKERATRRFLREAEAMASVQHDHVVTVHDQGLTPAGDPFLVMEYVDGVALSELVESAAERDAKGLPLDAAWLADEHGIAVPDGTTWTRLAVTWARDLAAGLAEVHAAGVLHRDIKPSNVIVRRDGRPLLLDFGLALLDTDSSLTRGHTSIGTPVYMPPEGLSVGGERTPASDVYSLAATLYHLVTLRQPYSGTPTEVLAAIATRDPLPVQAARRGLPRDLRAVVEHGMERRPQRRYASAIAFEADLTAFLEHRAVVARPTSGARRLARRTVRSRMVRGAVLALALVGLVAFSMFARAERAEERLARDFAIRAALPPTLSLVGPTNRTVLDPADRAQFRALLDEGVALDHSPVVLPLMRATFRLDHDDPAGAAADMARVAEAADTPYARALAERYAELAPDQDAVDIDDLPAPETAADAYLAGYHALRAGRGAAARAAFDTQGVAALPFGTELRQALVPYGGLEPSARYAAALESLDELTELERRQGAPSAASRHQISYALGILQRYREALDAARDAVALSPRAYVLRINAGYLAMRLDRYAEAREHLELAMELRPNYAKPLRSYTWTLIAEQRFDDALAVLRAAPLDPGPASERFRKTQELAVEVQRALAQRSAGDVAGMAATLDVAEALRAELGQLGSGGGANGALLDALRADDQEAIFAALTNVYLSDLGNTWLLETLTHNLPKDLSEGATDLAGELLESFVPPQLRLQD